MRDGERTVSVEVDLEIDGEAYETTFDRHYTWYTDNDYGADADGRRGVKETFIDSDLATDIIVEKQAINDLPPGFRQKVYDAINKYMTENTPSIEE